MYHHLMAFRWGTDVGEFLFPGLYINGLAQLIALCIVLILLSLAYEGIKVLQTQSKARTARERLHASSNRPSDTSILIVNKRNNNNEIHRNNISTSSSPSSSPAQTLKFFMQLSAFLFHNILGYMLMLSVMVYNIYVFIAVVFGMGMGYFLFGHIAMKINMENIRARTTNAMFMGGASTSGFGNITQLNYSPNSSSSSSATSFVNNACPSYTPTVHNNEKTNVDTHNQTEESFSCRL